ncbi:MAG: hypothetical protein Q7T19_11700 [Caulobacter sp.]|nr:hypothetical protein [Caulobacter sp.]
MSEREVIRERLRKKEQEIQSLEEKLRSAKVYVQALHDILKMVDRAVGESPSETVLKPGSTVSQARDVILTAGRPVLIDEILEAMGKAVTRDSRASLTGSLAAYVRRGEIFTRPAPNTYGLAELGHAEVDDEPKPPTGFGIQEDDEIDF